MTRGWARKNRQAISQEIRREGSNAITAHILAWEAFARAQTVMAYASYGAEVETDALLVAVLARGKHLALPRCGAKGEMEAHAVVGLDGLAVDRYGIVAPALDAAVIDREAIDLVLVPGLLFDWQGARLGQGGGYYDRYLAGYRGMTCALAFTAQVLPYLETRPHDVPMRALATEDGIFSVDTIQAGREYG